MSEYPQQSSSDIEQLKRFYAVETDAELISAQAYHIERLQARLPPLKDEQPRNPRA